MERKHLSCGLVCDQSPTLSAKYPWLVAQNLDDEEEDDTTATEQIVYTLHDPLSLYRCRIPELLGKRIRGCFHGWVILSDYHPHNVMWSLWNPVASKTIILPPLILKDVDFESINQCCLSSSPDDPTSLLMLTRTKTPTLVFCPLDRNKNRLGWKEMGYAKQLRSITGDDNRFLHCLTCCNGKVYALIRGDRNIRAIQVDIVVKDEQVVIRLLAFKHVPYNHRPGCKFMKLFLKGYCTQLFFICLFFYEVEKKKLGVVSLFKLKWKSMIWEEQEDLKDAMFFINLSHDGSVSYRQAIASELGGYIHILGDTGKVIYSYDVKDRTISLSSSLVQASHVSLWECSRLQGDHVKIIKSGAGEEGIMVVRSVRDIGTKNEENFETRELPFDVLQMIMEFCVGVEYLNMRATCKRCRLASPLIHVRRRLKEYSVVSSPWLVVLDNNRRGGGVITLKDPVFGDTYFLKMPQGLAGVVRIYCSKYGWLLMYQIGSGLLFFNPLTKEIRRFPYTDVYFETVCFSAPPTSPDCIMVGSTCRSEGGYFFIYFLKDSWWHMYNIDYRGTTPHSFVFSTFDGRDFYALNKGVLEVYRGIEGGCPFWDGVVAKAPPSENQTSAHYFLVNCDQHHLLLVVMDESGKSVEVLKLNDSIKEWEKMDSLGRHVIYICATSCLCMEAKTPELENKIFFPRLHSQTGKLVFYCLETCMYYTFNGRNIQQCLGRVLLGTKYLTHNHAWIEPSWS